MSLYLSGRRLESVASADLCFSLAVISANQFNSAVPLHCTDESLLSPSTLAPLSVEIPTFDSHTTQLLKLALQIHK